jgi:cyclophilin family peptidyl-prolyl cis-trans isomerase/HEAT repeat protein
VLRVAIFVATSLLVGCPSKQPEAPRAPEDTALRIRIANAEARRSGGVDELVQLATTGDTHQRELALRGLGRVGLAKARAALEQSLDDKDPRIVTAALYAIGVAAALDEDVKWNSAKLVAALPRAPLAALEALGRAGDASSQGELVSRLANPDPAIAAAAAIALGRHGRRKLAWSAEVRAALAKTTAHADAAVRYSATYALSREHEPPADEAVTAALIARIPDDDPETRASAVVALARRKAVAAAHKQIEESLRDRDWRVAAEAVRALAGPNGDDAGRVAVTAVLAQRLGELHKGHPTEAHVISEALRALIANPSRDKAAFANALQLRGDAEKGDSTQLTKGWLGCLSLSAAFAMSYPAASSGQPAATQPSGGPAGIATCHRGLPDHLRLPLLSELINAKAGDATFRRGALRVLLAHDDPRVRAAGLSMLPASWKDGDAKAQATIIGTISSALATKNPIVAGTAVDVAGELYDLLPAADPLRATLDSAVLTRARTETDIELASSLYALIGKRAIAGGADVCRNGLAGQPARAKAAADCLKALGEASPAPAATATEPPALDLATVVGKKLYWHLATTRGEIVIELRPDIAPWAVASIVSLTQRGFYDGVEFHRVVPNFVVQGGDPTMSGWGGPGYTLPAEPASSADTAGYVMGGVGVADAGRDSGGSQWFIMHSRAPHLDGRYTWFGAVVSGQKSADALLIGDRVDKATIEHR